MMRLKQDEIEMLEGKQGHAVQRAMELLVKYGEALGAEEFCDTANVCGTMSNTTPFLNKILSDFKSYDHMMSELNFDCSDVYDIPEVRCFSCQLEHGLDPDTYQIQGISQSKYEINAKDEEVEKRMNVNLICTCAPYLTGNVPVFGEHCAWMESSAVVYINSVIGARTNCEGRESAAASMLTGKTPYWGLHVPENRLGDYQINVEYPVESVRDWGLLGYYGGWAAGEKIPVFNGIQEQPLLEHYKHCGAAGASSGGTEMFHVVGRTPEARTMQEAFGGRKPKEVFTFGRSEARQMYDRLNSTAKSDEVDFVMLGCPHYSLKQLWQAAMKLRGKKVKDSVAMWIFIPRALKEVSDRNGYTKIIEDAGAVLMADTRPALGRLMPQGATHMATDSVKQGHYIPAILGLQSSFGSVDDCIEAAVSGRWKGEF